MPSGKPSVPPAEIASVSRTASESSSTERSARVANIDTTRERIGASSAPAGRLIRVSSAAAGRLLAVLRWRANGILSWTSVPWPAAPLSSKLAGQRRDQRQAEPQAAMLDVGERPDPEP